MRSLRSPSFLRPAKIILVPLMYFLGFLRYSNSVDSPHSTPAAQARQFNSECELRHSSAHCHCPLSQQATRADRKTHRNPCCRRSMHSRARCRPHDRRGHAGWGPVWWLHPATPRNTNDATGSCWVADQLRGAHEGEMRLVERGHMSSGFPLTLRATLAHPPKGNTDPDGTRHRYQRKIPISPSPRCGTERTWS